MATSKKPKRPRAPTGQKSDSAARMEKFCVAYFAKPNGKAAAVKAGYTERSAESTASRLLRSDKVKSRLQELAQAHASAQVATAQERREYLTKVLRDQVKDIATGGKELDFIRTPVPVAERTRAAVELSKMDGDYAPIKLDIKVTEYARSWLEDLFTVLEEFLPPEKVDEVAARVRRFDP